jgi:hypothetical protein
LAHGVQPHAATIKIAVLEIVRVWMRVMQRVKNSNTATMPRKSAAATVMRIRRSGLHGQTNGGGAPRDLEFGEYVAQMTFNCPFAEHQLGRDLAIALRQSHEPEHLQLALREIPKERSEKLLAPLPFAVGSSAARANADA